MSENGRAKTTETVRTFVGELHSGEAFGISKPRFIPHLLDREALYGVDARKAQFRQGKGNYQPRRWSRNSLTAGSSAKPDRTIESVEGLTRFPHPMQG
jgi:hypothetical protein